MNYKYKLILKNLIVNYINLPILFILDFSVAFLYK
jgi:hypothetical protein